MNPVLDAFWRAAAYCFHPRVILLSFLPVLVAGLSGGVLAWFYWASTVELLRGVLEQSAWVAPVLGWLDRVSGLNTAAFLAPLLLLMLAAPLLLIASLLLVSAFMSSAVVALVSKRRFPALERRYGGSWWSSVFGTAGATLAALLVLALSLPFWLVPPVALLLPPLIWGWLSYRVMSYDALAEHASVDERRELMRSHRTPLLAMGVITGYLGAAPSLVWATGALALPLMPVLLPLFVWLYTLVFAFAALWFCHFALAALDELRRRRMAERRPPAEILDPLPTSSKPTGGGALPLP
ncbi:MAG: EI24 domain-containing protein [Burkholderiales bacterium]|jgi:hypothetical protein|nr:EI24 domain-containing protein [Burkholderiales bacterium]